MDLFGRIIGALLVCCAASYLLMVAIPRFSNTNPSFGDCFIGLVALNLAWGYITRPGTETPA